MNFKWKLFLFLWVCVSTEAYAKECPKGTYLVREHPRHAYYRSDGTYVSKTTISSYCKNYRDDGLLKSEFKSMMPKGWPHKKEKFKKCSKKNLTRTQKILAELPKILTNVGSLKIYCADRSIYPNNPASAAPAAKIIVLYDSSFSGDLRRYIGHELAHVLYDRLSNEEKRELHKISLWGKDKNGKYLTTRRKFSEPDGANDPDEDFANNVENYLFNKEEFRKEFPLIFNWIDHLFGGEK